MYIAVMKYGEKSSIILGSKLAVLDTSDFSVELVSVEDVRKYLINDIHNVYVGRDGITLHLNGVGCTRYLQGSNSVELLDRRLNHTDKNGDLFVCNEFICSKRSNNNFDSLTSMLTGSWFLAYPFLFMDCMILRFVYLRHFENGNKTIFWYTVAVGNTGKVITHWEKGNPVGALAIKVDTLLEV